MRPAAWRGVLAASGCDVHETAAWTVLCVQLTMRLGWGEWTAEELQQAPEVQAAAKVSSSLKSALGSADAVQGVTLRRAMFEDDAPLNQRSYSALVRIVRSSLGAYLEDESKFGVAVLRGLRDEDKRQRTPQSAVSFCVVVAQNLKRPPFSATCTIFYERTAQGS